MSELSRSWCQDCKRWVPAEKMQYFNGMRVCIWCVEGIEQPEGFVYDPNHEKTQCIFCDSYDTIELAPKWGWYKCNTCEETFRRL